MRKRNYKRLFALLLILGLLLATTIYPAAAANNGWTILGTGGNVSLSTNSETSTTIAFNGSYNWQEEQAQLENKLIPVDFSTFEFKFKVNDLSGAWMPMVVCWSTVPQGPLYANGLLLNVEEGNLKIKRTQGRPDGEEVNVSIDPSKYQKIKIWTSGSVTNHVSVNGEEVYVFDDADFFGMATGASNNNLGLTLALGGGANNSITIDTDVDSITETETGTETETETETGTEDSSNPTTGDSGSLIYMFMIGGSTLLYTVNKKRRNTR